MFFDEPDPESVQSFYEELRKRADQGVAIFLTTFQADVTEKIATKVALLENAKIKKMGKLPDLYNQGKKQKLLKIRLSPLTNEEEKAIRQLFLLHGASSIRFTKPYWEIKGIGEEQIPHLFNQLAEQQIDVFEMQQVPPGLQEILSM